MTRGRRRASAVIGALALTACAARGPLVDGVDAGGRRLVVVLDRSTSMRDNDPDDAARAGVDLTLALAGARDNVAVVTFATSAEVVVPLRPAGGTAARAAARAALHGLERNGVSDVGRALERAREVLEAGQAPRGSPIVFLTDGVPYRQPRGRRLSAGPEVDAAVAAIAARGYRIFAIALGRGASTPFLNRLVASTGGAIVVARDPGELPAAFETVAIEALGYLRAERGDALTVLPHARRLAFLGRWDRAGQVGVVTHDGAAVDEAAVVRTPAPGAGAGPFGVALVEAPAPGAWRAELAGARDTVLLLEPGFSVDLEPVPPVVAAGAAVPVAVRLAGDPALVEQARPGLRLQARLELDGAAPGGWTPLAPGEPARLTAPPVREETAARVVVEAEVALGERTFQLRRARALTVQPADTSAAEDAPPADAPPAPLELTVRPTTFTRLVWEGDPLDPVRLTVRGDPARAARVTCQGVTVEVPARASRVLEVPCPEDGALTLTGDAEGALPFRLDLRGEVRRHRLSPARVTLPATPAGVASRPVPLAVALEPEGRAEVSPARLVLAHPSGHEVEVERGDDGLVARPGPDAPPGRYAGALVVVADAPRGLRSREVPVELEVLPAVRAPHAVAVHGGWGWVTRPVEVAWPTLEEVALTISPGPLRGDDATIDPELDIRVVPLDGWSGERLSHEPRRFALQVFLSSDLPAGVYRGALELVAAGHALSIPVELEVRR
ncbi:MAG: VWA domain-containing protein [Planctomycetes bacterium]|nr:VWA domain-containing protein [Planctomycetota bacterium]